VLGAAAAHPDRRHVLVTTVEHPSVLECARHLERQGGPVDYIPVDRDGRLDVEYLESRMGPGTALLSVMTANNETGVIFPIRQIAEIARRHGVAFHTDAVQAAGKVPLNFAEADLDLLSISGHKFHAPKGIGALVVRRGLTWPPMLRGGGQEGGRRSGTENVAAIVGLGEAAELARNGLGEMSTRVRALRDFLERHLQTRFPFLRVVGSECERLPNTSFVMTGRFEAETILALLDMRGICCSAGSACAAGAPERSGVLKAMGFSPTETRSAIRFSLSRYTGRARVEQAVRDLADVLDQLAAQA
jgi:cysteine desulfurase